MCENLKKEKGKTQMSSLERKGIKLSGKRGLFWEEVSNPNSGKVKSCNGKRCMTRLKIEGCGSY